METISHCPLCRKDLYNSDINKLPKAFLSGKDTLVTGNRFTIETCRHCGFLFTNPRPKQEEISKYYHSEAYISHTVKKQSLMDRIYFGVQKIMLARKINLLKKHTKPNFRKLLDYGCGTGAFLNQASLSSFVTVGYEPEHYARKIAQNKGLDVAGKKEKVLGNNTQTYHVISLWHVLEHLHEYPSILNDFYTKLNPGGILLIAVPIANSADAQHYKNHWAAWDLPRHLYHFTRESLVKGCNQTGFKLIENKGMPFDSYYISWLSEQNKKNPVAPLNAFLLGTWSNANAMIGQTPWSSEIFVFKKEG